MGLVMSSFPGWSGSAMAGSLKVLDLRDNPSLVTASSTTCTDLVSNFTSLAEL
jgi:hypothetical protein